ncbi:carboxyl transferase domain-containing protein [Plebeiibacterium sediminum]|uniref:Methylcrotonoyl-CoA carboxylase n=1 Tax=Plebeiibacterium sediminum TaxID=2992112 RepID=A0AAE3SI13_9BACT|nr:carboxyl transferase domain-containing protein [Plebeiobacterium sediminum]MCW3788703.1 methylcrotonoyl-CoA carboxylase [Plebeiobacterium sediminum]
MINIEEKLEFYKSHGLPAEVAGYKLKLEEISDQNTDKKALHKSKGKLLAHERIELLLDEQSPFLELSQLAAYNQYNNDFPSAGIITGIGYVHGRETMIIANDATTKGGTYVKETIKKHLRAQEIALENNLACIYLVDSGGIFLPEQANVFPDKGDFGRIFYNQARLSAQSIPQISIVMGSCTAGGAYIPAMSDETIIVKNQGTIFLGGPPLVKAATGEEVSAEELGGGDMHTSQSGVADHLADDDFHAIEICRNIFKYLHVPAKKKSLEAKQISHKSASHEIYKEIPEAGKYNKDVRKLIRHIIDDEIFDEFKSNYGSTLVTGFASINGFKVGILANNGILFSESSQKGAHFIQLCDKRNIPMIFLQNITGFMVGKDYEQKGIAKDGAKMVNALANTKVPFFTIIIGGSYGAGNYAMGGRAFNPRLLFSWPSASISVMGPQQAADVLTTIKKDQEAKIGKTTPKEALEKMRQSIMDNFNKEASPYYATSRLWDDGIIDPADTRMVLSIGLSIAQNQSNEKGDYGVFRM